MRSARIPAAGILLAGIAASAAGQAAEAPAWGTQDPSVLTLFAWDFQPTASSVSYGAEFFSIYSSTIDFRFFSAGVRLPSGARVTAIQLEGCDESIGGRIVFGFQVLASPVGGVTTPLAADTGTLSTPGCSFFADAAAGLAPIDNLNNVYRASFVFEGAAGPALRVRAVRIFYRLTVSPAPGTATFDDVPVGHPYRQFIEALNAAGITGGCNASPPLFCPDQPITRGQMAVFLAVALGLHFPN